MSNILSNCLRRPNYERARKSDVLTPMDPVSTKLNGLKSAVIFRIKGRQVGSITYHLNLGPAGRICSIWTTYRGWLRSITAIMSLRLNIRWGNSIPYVPGATVVEFDATLGQLLITILQMDERHWINFKMTANPSRTILSGKSFSWWTRTYW